MSTSVGTSPIKIDSDEDELFFTPSSSPRRVSAESDDVNKNAENVDNEKVDTETNDKGTFFTRLHISRVLSYPTMMTSLLNAI